MLCVSAGACNINMLPWEQRARQLVLSSICCVFETIRQRTFEQVRSSLVLKLFNCSKLNVEAVGRLQGVTMLRHLALDIMTTIQNDCEVI